MLKATPSDATYTTGENTDQTDVDSSVERKNRKKYSTLAQLFWDSGNLLIAIAAFLFSLSSLFVKLLGTSLPVYEVVLIPSAVCWTLTLITAYFTGTDLLHYSKKVFVLTLARGVLGAITLIFYFASIEWLDLKDAVALFFCSPVLAALLEWLIKGSRIECLSIVGCILAVVGVLFVSEPSCIFHHNEVYHMDKVKLIGMAFATAAAATNAGAFVIVGQIKTSNSALSITWWYHTVVCAVAVLALLLKFPSEPIMPTQSEGFFLAGIAGTQFLGQILLNRGLQLMTATHGASINVLQVLFSCILDVLFSSKSLSASSVIGGLCVMAGVVFVTSGETSMLPPEQPDLQVV